MTTADNMVPVRCVLAKHHKPADQHSDEGTLAARPCNHIIRYEERVAEAGVPPSRPAFADMGPEDFRGSDDPEAPTDIREPVEAGGDCRPWVDYPLLDVAIINVISRSLMGLSVPGILVGFPGADPERVGEAINKACESGAISFYMSDDDPPVRVYIEAQEKEPIPPPTPPAPVPAVPAETPEENVQRVVGRATEDAMRMTVPAEPPALADLTYEMCRAKTDMAEAIRAEREAHEIVVAIDARLSAAISAVAKHIGRGSLVSISGSLFRSVAPRKKGGGDGDGALWRLEPVEVKR